MLAAKFPHGPKNIVILRALVLGDMLCAVPAFRAIKRFWPETKITLVGLPWARNFVARFKHYLDDFIEFPGFPGLPERPVDVHLFPQFLQKVQQREFDLALQMHGSGSYVNPLMMLFGAKVNAGFCEADYSPDPESFIPFPDIHEIGVYLKLTEHLGIPAAGQELEFPLFPQDADELLAIPEAAALKPKDYVCVHPGARLLTRRWFAQHFAKVANQLSNQGFKVVITGGPDEVELAERVAERIEGPYINLAGKTTLGALAVLIKNASLLISNDTGVSHIAAAVRTPSVIVVTGSDPRRWAPLNDKLHRTMMHYVPCRPCFYQSCPFDLMCAKGISPSEVITQADFLLKRYGRQSDETSEDIDLARAWQLSLLSNAGTA